MKVIFLDIDGVLNSRQFYEKQKNRRISADYEWKETDDVDPKAVKVLNKILQKTGAKIVISSSWRVGRSIDHLRELAQSIKINPDLIIGKTPSHMFGRGKEIQEWLKEHEDVGAYLIIDDDDFDMGPMKKHMLKTDPTTGLTMGDAIEIIKKLQKGEEK